MPKIPKTKNIVSKVGAGAMIGFNAWSGYSDYKDYRVSGDSNIIAGAKTVGGFMLDESLGWWALPFRLLPGLGSAAVNGYESLGKLTRQMNYQSKQVPFVNAKFNDFNQAFTMRQAGMKLAEQSRYNLQQTLMGNEASMLRRR